MDMKHTKFGTILAWLADYNWHTSYKLYYTEKYKYLFLYAYFQSSHL